MRLRLDNIPAEAEETLQPDGCRQVRLQALTILLSPLLPGAVEDALPEARVIGPVQQPALPALAARDCPADCRLRIGDEKLAETALGWPLRLIFLQVCREGNDAPVEERLVAVYQFLRYSAAALVRGPALAEHRPQLTALLQSGRPQWHDPDSGTVTALWDIWR